MERKSPGTEKEEFPEENVSNLDFSTTEELDKAFISTSTFLNAVSITDKDLRFDVDRSKIFYLSAFYVEILREFIIEMYKESDDPIVRGYVSKSNLSFTMDYVKSVYNDCGTRRERVVRKAAYIFYNINTKHPFTDGNKRTALIACNSFLEYNGYSIGSLPFRKSYRFITEVAKGERTLEECFNFINENLCRFEIPEDTREKLSELIRQLKKRLND